VQTSFLASVLGRAEEKAERVRRSRGVECMISIVRSENLGLMMLGFGQKLKSKAGRMDQVSRLLLLYQFRATRYIILTGQQAVELPQSQLTWRRSRVAVASIEIVVYGALIRPQTRVSVCHNLRRRTLRRSRS